MIDPTVHRRPPPIRPAKFIIFNTKFLVLDTQLLVFLTKFIIFTHITLEALNREEARLPTQPTLHKALQQLQSVVYCHKQAISQRHP